MSREPSLEELFLAHYGAGQRQRRRAGSCQLNWPSGRPASAGRWPATVVARQTAHKAVRSGVLWGYVFGPTWRLRHSPTPRATRPSRERARHGQGVRVERRHERPGRPRPRAPDRRRLHGVEVPRRAGRGRRASGDCSPGPGCLRGEEDAGRWELLLAGQTTRRAAAAQALAGFGCGVAACGWSPPSSRSRSAVLRRSASVSAARCSWPSLSSRRGGVPRRRSARQPAGGHPPPGGRLRRRRSRSELRAAHGGRLRHRPRLAAMGLAARLGRAAPAPDCTPAVCAPADRRLVGLLAVHRSPGGERDLGGSTFPDRAGSVPARGCCFGPSGLERPAHAPDPRRLGGGDRRHGAATRPRRQVGGECAGELGEYDAGALTPRSDRRLRLSRCGIPDDGRDPGDRGRRPDKCCSG